MGSELETAGSGLHQVVNAGGLICAAAVVGEAIVVGAGLILKSGLAGWVERSCIRPVPCFVNAR